MKILDRSHSYSRRMATLRSSCIRDILNAASNGKVISFAGGLPNPRLFPVDELSEAASRVLKKSGKEALQYSSTEGFQPLREYVAGTLLRRRGFKASPDEILITNGSQQGLDLIGKAYINPGDSVIMESPTYLSAIQAFELYEPEFLGVPMHNDGPDLEQLGQHLDRRTAKLVYCIPNFQNPSGLCYSAEKRQAAADLIRAARLLLVEDDPYRELRFEGEDLPAIHRYEDQPAVLVGTFSKMLSPGLRMGWLHASEDVIRRLVVVKQATDLCSSDFMQRWLYEILTNYDLDGHLAELCRAYRRQRDQMLEALRRLLPEETQLTIPLGGMFIWVTLPQGVSSEKLLAATLAQGVVFAPGRSFYPAEAQENTLRLNFTNTEGEAMEAGMRILAREVWRQMAGTQKRSGLVLADR